MWLDEADRRFARMENGEDPGLTIEEFFSDNIGEAAVIDAKERWRTAWSAEIERRRKRLESGEDRELTLDEFLDDSTD